MLRTAAFLAFFSAISLLRGGSPALVVENELLPSPAGVGATKPSSAGKVNDALFFNWEDAAGRLSSAVFDPAKKNWATAEPFNPTQSSSPQTPPPASENQERYELAQRAGRTAQVCFKPDPKDPSIQLSVRLSPSSAFLMPLRVEDSRPCGHPSLALLADGTVFVSWPEHYNQDETALWLRRVSPGGSLSVPVLLAVLPENPAEQMLLLVKDFDEKPAQLLLAYSVGEGETAQIVTRLLTIAPAAKDLRRRPCDNCPDADEAARGHGLRGKVIALSAENKTVSVKHASLEGILPAGTTEFKVDPAVLQSAAIGKELFARIEKRGNDWWLFAPSWIVRTTP